MHFLDRHRNGVITGTRKPNRKASELLVIPSWLFHWLLCRFDLTSKERPPSLWVWAGLRHLDFHVWSFYKSKSYFTFCRLDRCTKLVRYVLANLEVRAKLDIPGTNPDPDLYQVQFKLTGNLILTIFLAVSGPDPDFSRGRQLSIS